MRIKGFGIIALLITLLLSACQDDLEEYNVQFKDYNGHLLSYEVVIANEAATAPPEPEREGYTFSGWSTTFDKVTSDLEIIAEYEINTYDVTFVDKDENIISE